MKTHPMQPLYLDPYGTVRFKENAIVRRLLETSTEDLNTLAFGDFSQEDRTQLAQLLGYSLCGFHELPYVTDEVALAASNKTIEDLGKKYEGCRDTDCPIHCDKYKE